MELIEHRRKFLVADNCYRVSIDGHKEYLWVEVHTGSEGYDEKVFIPRLISAERFLSGRGKFLVIVPFKRDVTTVKHVIHRYNLLAEEDETKPVLDLQLSEVISYQGISSFREKIGIYSHKKRV